MNAYLPLKFFFLFFLGLFSRHNDDDVAGVSTSAPPAMDSTSDETDPTQGSTNGDPNGDMIGGDGLIADLTDNLGLTEDKAHADAGLLDDLIGGDGLIADLTDNLGLTEDKTHADAGLLDDLIGGDGLVADLTDGLGLTEDKAHADAGLLDDLIGGDGLIADLTDNLGLTEDKAHADAGLLDDLIGGDGLIADLTDGLGLIGEATDRSDHVERVDTPLLDLFPELSSLYLEDMDKATDVESDLAVTLEASLAIKVDIDGDCTDLNAMFGLAALGQSDFPEDKDEDDEDLLFFL